MGKIFKVDFAIEDYADILPNVTEYMKHDEVVNYNHYQRGNTDLCFWQKHRPTPDEIKSPEFREREITRILKTGIFACIFEEILWIPPAYYLALQYGKVGEDDLQFRLKRLKHVYFRIRCRNNPNCAGSLSIKNRADGETTMAISDGLWECGVMSSGQVGIQSKTRSDAVNPCWSTAQIMWQSYPKWLKDTVFSDMVSGDNIAEKMQWMREENEEKGITAKNVRMQYYPCVFNAMDGKHNMKSVILDEVCKWVEAEFYDTFTNYSKFVMPGFERRGLFNCFSSPSDIPCKSNEQVHSLWQDSDTEQMNEATGTTKSRIHRYYSNPLDGIQGAYDKFGDVEPQKIYDWIMERRKAAPKDKLMGEIRGFPLNESEMFDSPDGQSLWDNKKGIETRKIYLIGHKYKDEKTKEPIVVYGNLEWHDGVQDSDVDFRMSDRSEFDLQDSRFCFSYLPQDKEPLRNIFHPPSYVQDSLGIDPFDKRYPGKSFSNGAMVNHRFRDIHETGIVKCPTMIYCNRPNHNEIFYEDCIKATIFCRAMTQPESINSKVIDYYEDRGYMSWLLAKIGEPRNSLIKGDAPSGGKNALLDEIIGLINGITNTPLPGTDDPYLLERNWFYQLLDDVSKFNRVDTHANDLSMAWGMSLLGAAKILYKRIRQPNPLSNGVLEYLLT